VILNFCGTAFTSTFLNFGNQKIIMELVHEIANLSVNILFISMKTWQGYLLNSYFGRTNEAPIAILFFSEFILRTNGARVLEYIEPVCLEAHV